MKIRVIHSILALLTVCSLSAQIREARPEIFKSENSYHFGYVQVSAGYASLQSGLANTKIQGNAGGSVGIGYEFRNNGLWINTGLQMSLLRCTMDIGAEIFDYPGFDTQGKAATFHYRVTQQDRIEWNTLDIPLMAGYYFHGAHVGLGVKVSYAFKSQSATKGIYTLSATNEAYGITFENMPEYGYKDYPSERQEANKLNIGASLIGELGYDLLSLMPSRKPLCHVLKIAFYFEYGLNNMLSETTTPASRLEFTNPKNATEAVIHPYLNTQAKPARTVPYFTGLKLTYMIGGNKTDRSKSLHKGCGCYE